MPSGYTSIIADGKTFKEFTLQCSRAFGALISMKDEPYDSEIPNVVVTTSNYHLNELSDAKKQLKLLENY